MASFNFTKDPEDKFHPEMNTTVDYLEENHERLGSPNPDLTLNPLRNTYNDAYAATKAPDPTKSAVPLRKAAREALTKELNKYGKEYLFNNHRLTLEDKLAMKIHIDKEREKVGKPEGQVAVALSFPGGPFKVAVHLGPQEGTAELDTRGDYGYAVYIGKMPPGGATVEQAASSKHYLMTPPVSGDDLLYYKFTRKKKIIVTFDPHESGMTAYICSRYENQKGESGDWGKIVSTIIP
jgi:hypothetical protein